MPVYGAFFFFFLKFPKSFQCSASPHNFNKHRTGKICSVQPDSFLMLLAGETALLAPALIYSLEEINYKWKQDREKQWLSPFISSASSHYV